MNVSSENVMHLDGSSDDAYALARRQYESGKLSQAAWICQRLLSYFPSHGPGMQLFGAIACRNGQFDVAVDCFRRALVIMPDASAARSNLATTLKNRGRLGDAEQQFRVLLASHPNLLAGYYNFASLLQHCHRFDSAIAMYRRAIVIDTHCVDAHWNLALNLLRIGQFAEGWAEYEWRWQRPGTPVEHRGVSAWTGEALDGKTLLLTCEQGLGDTLQFLRYVRVFDDRLRSGTVILRCQAELVSLLDGYPGISQVMATCEPPPPCDVQASLMSLPGLWGTTTSSIPCEVPYLHVPSRRVAMPKRSMRVGLVWGSSPTDPSRSCPLSALTWMGAIRDLKVFSLQKGPHQGQLSSIADAGFITDLSHKINDMADTAALLQDLDLVVTVDTSVAHLAGALGRPVWILLPHLADWRWLLDRDDSPWYPTARLFRQASPGDWEGVMRRLEEALVQHMQAWRQRV
ncbi:tetratricopeptide repeat protein [Azospirillum picis]|uniref:Tfp pilus assembly protein PilF n=1 Tax=Azospirillum picis TaxID=488438 RepID=A0ABU0MTN4_9PROT|nr:tetratricopeptide repeat-containing glycosyltransferase family protein [Azospirillum picis]MBP2303079.1 Tfp pilus assembly protein PilF [Azospirillum picis]MDQ0536807.1 Tfp pilus assembly protein PilF [Azospirillum picis]